MNQSPDLSGELPQNGEDTIKKFPSPFNLRSDSDTFRLVLRALGMHDWGLINPSYASLSLRMIRHCLFLMKVRYPGWEQGFMLAIASFRNLLNYPEELCSYSFRESRFPSLCSKMLDDCSSPCDPSVIVELLNTVSVLVAHLADPITAHDLIPCVDIFLPVLAINRGPQEATI
jgi:hypothetical protein